MIRAMIKHTYKHYKILKNCGRHPENQGGFIVYYCTRNSSKIKLIKSATFTLAWAAAVILYKRTKQKEKDYNQNLFVFALDCELVGWWCVDK